MARLNPEEKRMKYLTVFITLFCLLGSCGHEEDPDAAWVSFQGRKVNLTPYFKGFPYKNFHAYYDAGRLFYLREDTTTVLMQVSLDGSADLKQGKVISDIDYAKRNVWTVRFSAADQKLYWSGDEINDEIINLFRLDPESGNIEKLTDVPYIYGWNFNAPKDKIAFIARLGHIEKRLGELRVLDLTSNEEKTILKDTPEFRFTWADPSWQPQGEGVVVSMVKDADRNLGNLAYVDFKSGKLTVLTDARKTRKFPYANSEWLNNDQFLYLSNEDGFSNVYKYDIRTGTGSRVTQFDRDLSQIEIVELDGVKSVVAVIGHPVAHELFLIDPADGKTVHSMKTDGSIEILDVSKNQLLVQINSAVTKFRIDEVAVTRKAFAFANKVDIGERLKKQIVHTDVERVEYSTFDIDPATGKPRMLHAFLYSPKDPLPKDKQVVMIQSFYGGENEFNTSYQILANAGIHVLSPSPRGSSGFGLEFASLNDKDLGGNEIIDVIYAAKFVSEKLDIPPSRIGVFGGSHGGYATMRLLTFPGEINGNEANFDWGFGISHAGFSDIIHFYKTCNIPDWVTLEAGDPETEAPKLKDRSPLYHADKMVGKLLLTHGTNDSRVPIEGSRWMADSLLKYQKDVTLVEFKEQGHGIKGLENNVRRYETWFRFLETVR